MSGQAQAQAQEEEDNGRSFLMKKGEAWPRNVSPNPSSRAMLCTIGLYQGQLPARDAVESTVVRSFMAAKDADLSEAHRQAQQSRPSTSSVTGSGSSHHDVTHHRILSRPSCESMKSVEGRTGAGHAWKVAFLKFVSQLPRKSRAQRLANMLQPLAEAYSITPAPSLLKNASLGRPCRFHCGVHALDFRFGFHVGSQTVPTQRVPIA